MQTGKLTVKVNNRVSAGPSYTNADGPRACGPPRSKLAPCGPISGQNPLQRGAGSSVLRSQRNELTLFGVVSPLITTVNRDARLVVSRRTRKLRSSLLAQNPEPDDFACLMYAFSVHSSLFSYNPPRKHTIMCDNMNCDSDFICDLMTCVSPCIDLRGCLGFHY